MISSLCPLRDSATATTLDISPELMTRMKAWQKIEQDLDPQSTIHPEQRRPGENPHRNWVIFQTDNLKMGIKVQSLARLLLKHEEALREDLDHQKSHQGFVHQLEERFLLPSFHHLYQSFSIQLKSTWTEIIKQIEATYFKIIPVANAMIKSGPATHFNRKSTETSLPLDIDQSGCPYAILKLHQKTPPFDKGYVKKLYCAVNLHHLKPCAWAKISLSNHPEISQQQLTIDTVNEIQLQRSFNTPQFVEIYHWCTYPGKNGASKIGIMMEYCDSNLEALLNDRSFNPSPSDKQHEKWNILEDICSALEQMEARSVHHRDIKPANIFLVKTAEGYRAKVGDFGFACYVDDEIDNPRRCGSPEFIAPEYIKAHRDLALASRMVLACEQKFRYGETEKEFAQMYFKDAMRLINESEAPVYAMISDPVQNKITKGEMAEKRGNEVIEKAEKELELARKIRQDSCLQAAETKGDVWALGLILFQMRTGQNPGDMLMQEDTSQYTTAEFLDELTRITQRPIDSALSASDKAGPLQDLNRRMLAVDPAQRLSARECLDEVRRLRANSAPFL